MEKNSNLNPQVCSVQYAPVSDIISVSIIRKLCKVIFCFGKTWSDFYITPGSSTFEFPQDQISGNTIFKQKVTMLFPGLDISNLSDLFNSTETLFIVKVTMNSGDEYIIGCKENPAQYLEDFGTSKSGRSIIFWCNSPDKPFAYQQ